MHSIQGNAGQEQQQELGSRGGGVLCSWGEPGFGKAYGSLRLSRHFDVNGYLSPGAVNVDQNRSDKVT
jgi:hypothetical protein